MNKKPILNILSLFTIVTILLTAGIVLTLFWKNSRKKEEGTSITFGNLSSPINDNITSNLTTDWKAEASKLTYTNNIYKIDIDNDFYPSKDLASKIAENLDFQPTFEESDISLYGSGQSGESLEYNDEIHTIILYLYPEDSTLKSQLADDEEAKLLAKTKLEETDLWPYNEKYSTFYRYYAIVDYNYYEVESRKEASLIGVVFTSIIDDIPLVTSRMNSGEIEVLIDLSNQINKITYAYRPIDPDVVATYPIKSLDTALNQIESKNGELIIPFEGENPSSLTIREVTLAYRIEYKDQKYLQPVYIFEGTDNNEQIVTVIVPAVENQYLK